MAVVVVPVAAAAAVAVAIVVVVVAATVTAAAAVTAAGWPDTLALVAANGSPRRSSNAARNGCAGIRRPMLSPPRAAATTVKAPGQN